jgi:hypothetical protein
MRYFLIIILLTIFFIKGNSQIHEELYTSDSITILDQPLSFIETHPTFPSGDDSLWCFIESNLNFELLNYQDKYGKVLAFFNIDTTGKVFNIETNPVHTQRFSWYIKDSLIENEIKRVIKLSPIWSPGLQRDRPVPVGYVLPINIPYTDYKCDRIENPTAIYWKVDKYAQFHYKDEKETKKSLEKFVGENGVWPSQDDCSGKVFIRVIINEQGELSDYLILKGLDSCRGFNKEALRLVELMPKWIPAELDGKPVKSYTVIPISFILR